jgi:hypothetical protein
MAMGSKGQRQAETAIRSNRPFTNSTGSFSGTRGSTRDLGWLSRHPQKLRIRELLGRATYVVWSYGTPIGCVAEDEDGDPTNYYFDESFSRTTGGHQSILRYAFSDFETVGTGPWSRSQGRVVRQVTGGYGHAPRAQFNPLAAAMEVGAVRAERDQPTREQMLDPRYGDPDWTPWRQFGSSLPEGADERDRERVERDGGVWAP